MPENQNQGKTAQSNNPLWTILGCIAVVVLCVLCSLALLAGYWVWTNWGNPTIPSGPISTSCGAPVAGPISFRHPSNMDVGDPALISVVYAWDTVNRPTAFVGVIESQSNLDFENPQIEGQYYHFTTRSDAVCFANSLARQMNATQKVYVGTGSVPSGFTAELPVDGWIMSTTAYAEAKIEVPGSVWKTVNLPMADKHNFIAKGTIYGQFWGGNAKVVDHFIVEKGYMLTTVRNHGTYWEVTGGDYSLLVSRFLQMSDEVQTRDDPDVINKYYCGSGTSPSGYNTTLPQGWVCSKN